MKSQSPQSRISWCRLRPIQILILLAVLCLGQSLVHPQAPEEQLNQVDEEDAPEETLQQEARVTRDERDHPAQEAEEELRQEDFPVEEEDIAIEEEGEPQHHSGLTQDHNGIWTLETYESFAQVLKETQDDRPHGLLLALLYTYSESCQADHDPWLSKLEDASQYVQDNLILADAKDIQFGSLETSQWEGAAEWLTNIGVETTPTLVFVVARNFANQDNDNQGASHAFLLDYIGPLETPEDVGDTVLQYYTRLFLTSTTPTTNIQPFPNLPDDFAAQNVPRQFARLDEVRQFWQELSPLAWKIAQSVQNEHGGVSQHWTPSDRHFIRWLMSGADNKQANSWPTITVFVQCQAVSNLVEFNTFAEMAWILSSRRDVWFVGVTEECPPNMSPGQVGAYRFAYQQDEGEGWTAPAAVSEEYAYQKALSRFLIHHSTPAALWFDRYATAPIAFADDYQVHFLLLVNLHPLNNEVPRYSEGLEQLVQDFFHHCRELKKNPDNNNIMCLIVPSTETRLLTTFGIDFWSPLDDRVSSPTKEVPPPAFPTLLITDRRPKKNHYRDGSVTTTHAVLRYLLRPTDILEEHAVTRFVMDFWNQRLLPELKSTEWQEDGVRVNKFGVTTLNALEFQQRFQTMATTNEHALVLFTQPSCGHCKRFHNIYNEASKVLRDIQWDQHMKLYKIEISQSNEVHGIPLPWLPDLYYFPPNSAPTTEQDPSQSLPIAPVRYDITDQFGNGVGRLSDPVEVIEWWLDVMVAEGNWMNPDVLLKILDQKEGTTEQD